MIYYGCTVKHSDSEQNSEAGQNNSGSSLTLNPGDKITDKPSFPQASSRAAGRRAVGLVGLGREGFSEGSAGGTAIPVTIPVFLQAEHKGVSGRFGPSGCCHNLPKLKELNLSTCAREDCELPTAVTKRQHSFLLLGFLSSFCCYYPDIYKC